MSDNNMLYMKPKDLLRMSCSIITTYRHWYVTLALLLLINLIPVIGMCYTIGFFVEYARYISWGYEPEFRLSAVSISQGIFSGFRSVVISLIYVFVVTFCLSCAGAIILDFVFPMNAIFGLIFILFSIGVLLFFALMGIFVMYASVRAAIYSKFRAGFNIKNIFKVIEGEPWSFGCCVGISLVLNIVSFLLSLGFMPVLAPGTSSLYAGYEPLYAGQLIFVFIIVFSYVCTGIVALQYIMIGLATSCYSVASWSDPSQPIPAHTPFSEGVYAKESAHTNISEPSLQAEPLNNNIDTQRDFNSAQGQKSVDTQSLDQTNTPQDFDQECKQCDVATDENSFVEHKNTHEGSVPEEHSVSEELQPTNEEATQSAQQKEEHQQDMISSDADSQQHNE